MQLWSWGANSHGQLGQNVINEQVCQPTKIFSKNLPCENFTNIACGGGHSLLLDNNKQIYACGWNHKLQLGTENDSQNFQRLWNLSGIKFIHVCCGWDFSCGITDDKFLFVWGSNSHGQIGLPRNHFSENVKPIRLQVNATAVSMGLRHTAIINSKGEIWITGCGKYGQLGLGLKMLKTDRFEKVPKVGKISHLACGQNHTIVWSAEENILYVWGDNKHGQLLLNTEKYKKMFDPQKIDIDIKQKVKKLLSGWTNALLWLEDGKLLTWGRNNYGQLGVKNSNTNALTQVVLPGNRKVIDVALGSEHTVCLATDNTLWAWGWNEHSNTGTVSGDYVFVPTLVTIDLKPNELITSIFCGGGHNFLITDNANDKELTE